VAAYAKTAATAPDSVFNIVISINDFLERSVIEPDILHQKPGILHGVQH
jgi:hypothetical protein